jgi:hypothetical protein
MSPGGGRGAQPLPDRSATLADSFSPLPVGNDGEREQPAPRLSRPLAVAASLDSASEGNCQLRPPEETGKAGAQLRKDRGSPAFRASQFEAAPPPAANQGGALSEFGDDPNRYESAKLA